MRTFFTFLILLGSTLSYAKTKRSKLFEQVYKLDHALLEKDSTMLKAILHDSVSYGHSNGWIERKRDVIGDVFNGKLDYKAIENGSKLQVDIIGNTAIILLNIKVKVVVDKVPVDLKLQVLEVWRMMAKDWQLLARQSVKVDK